MIESVGTVAGQAIFVYANVPYRIKSLAIFKNPRSSLEFDTV